MNSTGTHSDPRIARSRRRGREAALAELAARGLGGFTIESVAARAGLGKSTIYRLWGDRRALVLDALEELNRQPRPEPDGAMGRARVEELLIHLTEAWGLGSPTGDVLPALVDAAERDPELGRALGRYSQQRMAALVAAVAEAVGLGEARPDIEPELAARALAGAVLHARLLGRRPFPPGDVASLVDLVLGPAA